jgi:hypothetical protein
LGEDEALTRVVWLPGNGELEPPCGNNRLACDWLSTEDEIGDGGCDAENLLDEVRVEFPAPLILFNALNEISLVILQPLETADGEGRWATIIVLLSANGARYGMQPAEK